MQLSNLNFGARSLLAVRALAARLQDSRLLGSSVVLLASTLVSSGCGFFFWALAARMASQEAVALATAAVAVGGLLLSLVDLGLGPTIIARVGRDPHQGGPLINAAIAAGWLFSLVAALIFLIGIPLWAPGLLSLRHTPLLAITFVGFTVLSYLLTLQDAAMLAIGRSGFIFWRNLGCNGTPLLLLFPMTALVGPFAAPLLAFCLPNVAVGLVAGAFVLPRTVAGYRLFGRLDLAQLRGIAADSLGMHAMGLVWGSMGFLLPIIAVNTVGLAGASSFAISWMLISVLLMVPRSVTGALFAAGAADLARLAAATRRAALMLATIGLPAALVLWLVGPTLLGFFGPDYINAPLLRILILATLPFTVNSVVFVVLRVQRCIGLGLLFVVFVAACTLALASILGARMGNIGLAWGWLAGQSVGALGAGVGTLLLSLWRRR